MSSNIFIKKFLNLLIKIILIKLNIYYKLITNLIIHIIKRVTATIKVITITY